MADILISVLMAALSAGLTAAFLSLFMPAPEPGEDGGPAPQAGGIPKVYCILALAADMGVAVFMRRFYHTDYMDIAKVMLLLAALWACAWTDGKTMLIPNKILAVTAGLRVVLILAELLIQPHLFKYNVVSSLLAALMLFLASLMCRLMSRNAIGFGDVKLMMVMGLCLRSDRAWPAILVSMILSFFYSLYLLLIKKADRSAEIPFAPILLAGTLVASIITTV